MTKSSTKSIQNDNPASDSSTRIVSADLLLICALEWKLQANITYQTPTQAHIIAADL